MMSAIALFESVYAPVGAPGATVSLVTVAVLAAEMLPAASAVVAERVTAPSPSVVVSSPVTVTTPAPARPGTVAVTLVTPRVTTTVTVSLAIAEAGSVTATETLARFARLTYAEPWPPPFARTTAVGSVGATASAVAPTMGLSRLSSPPPTARRR